MANTPSLHAPTKSHFSPYNIPTTTNTSITLGELVSHSLPCSTTAGLLASVPPPLYSAVTPDSSPVRGQSHVRALSTELSTEGMSPAPNNMVAPSTTTTAPGSSQDTSPLSRSCVAFQVLPSYPDLDWLAVSYLIDHLCCRWLDVA